MGLAQERGEHRDHQQHQQPGDVHRERRGEGDEGDDLLHRREQEREQPDAADRLPPRPLELVVQLGVLELLQVERRRVAHQLDARLVGEEIAEQALEQRRDARQSLAHEGDGELDGQQLDQADPVDARPAPCRADRMHQHAQALRLGLGGVHRQD